MVSVVSILGHLASQHSSDIRDALLQLFRVSVVYFMYCYVMLSYVVLCCVFCYVMLSYVVLCSVMLCPVGWCCLVLYWVFMLCCVRSCWSVLCSAILCPVGWCCVMIYYVAMLCCVCHFLLWYTVIRYGMSWTENIHMTTSTCIHLHCCVLATYLCESSFF